LLLFRLSSDCVHHDFRRYHNVPEGEVQRRAVAIGPHSRLYDHGNTASPHGKTDDERPGGYGAYLVFWTIRDDDVWVVDEILR
jgi:hypothetical protein